MADYQQTRENRRHSLFEDIYAFLTGSAFAVVGLVTLKAAGLVTGGMAGLGLLLSYLLPLPPGILFALLNIPFFGLACRVMGRDFLVRAVAVNVLISGFAVTAPSLFRIEQANGPFAALFGGTLIGVGILQLARHQAGVGGLGVLALVLQKSRGINAGRTLLIGDALILSAAIPVLGMDASQFLLSMLSALATAGVLITFHKPGRYTGY